MAFQPSHKILVQASFIKLAGKSEEAAAMFYARLFELDPSLRPLFKSDIREQGRKLMQMIGVAVGSLDRLDALVPAVQALGKRHVGYGVTREHYDTVGTALLWTIEQALGSESSPEIIEAWAATYGLLVDTATAGLYEAVPMIDAQ
jgi:hemoglobin-like flavoprotein